VEGLIQSQLLDIAKDTLENFMDEIETYGFIPNGGRIYCTVFPSMRFSPIAEIVIYPDLNRSQPPLFIMVCLIHAVAFGIPHTKWIRCSQIMSRPRMILRSSIERSLWLRHVTTRHHFPAAEDIPQRELAWWSNNRSLAVTSPYTNKTYTLSRYAVTNSAPRPESYLTGMSCHHTCGTLMKRLT